MKKSNGAIGNRTSDFLSCNLARASTIYVSNIQFLNEMMASEFLKALTSLQYMVIVEDLLLKC